MRTLTLIGLFVMGVTLSTFALATSKAPKGYWKCSYLGTEMVPCRTPLPGQPSCPPQLEYVTYTSSWQRDKIDAKEEALSTCESRSLQECEFDECWQKN